MNVSLFNLSFLHCVEKQCILACCILPEEKLVPLLLLQWLSLIVFWCKMTHQRRTLLFDYKEGDQNATFTVWCFDLRKKEIFAITLQSSFSRNIKKNFSKIAVFSDGVQTFELMFLSLWKKESGSSQSPTGAMMTASNSPLWVELKPRPLPLVEN